MRRREFIAGLGGAAVWPLVALAQQPKLLRVGTVAGNPKSAPQWVAFEQRMAELGYHEGKNFAFEFIQAANIDDYASGYRELVARKVDILLALGPRRPATCRSLAATTMILICLLAVSWPALPAPIDLSDISVIDGDTIRVYHKQPNVRLVGFNAPETRKAQCDKERGLGARATRRVRDLV